MKLYQRGLAMLIYINYLKIYSLLDDISDKGLQIVTATAREIKEVETKDK